MGSSGEISNITCLPPTSASALEDLAGGRLYELDPPPGSEIRFFFSIQNLHCQRAVINKTKLTSSSSSRTLFTK